MIAALLACLCCAIVRALAEIRGRRFTVRRCASSWAVLESAADYMAANLSSSQCRRITVRGMRIAQAVTLVCAGILNLW